MTTPSPAALAATYYCAEPHRLDAQIEMLGERRRAFEAARDWVAAGDCDRDRAGLLRIRHREQALLWESVRTNDLR